MPLLTVANLRTSSISFQTDGLAFISLTITGSATLSGQVVTVAQLSALEPQLKAAAAASHITWSVADDPSSAADSPFAASLPGPASITAGAEAANARLVTIQLKNLDGANLAAKAKATVWISATAGGVPAATAPDGAVSVSTGTLLKELTTKVLHEIVSDAAGIIAISITESTAKSFFVNVALGNVVTSSTAIAWV